MMAPKGHRNLGIRGGATLCDCMLTLINIAYGGNVPIDTWMAICQFWAGVTLIHQWHTANPKMFIARAIPSYIRCGLAFYSASCGRRWFWDECNTEGWSDIRLPFRILHCFAAVRFFCNGLSLTLQYIYPKRGVGIRGNEQLFYRGCVRLSGVPLHLTRAFLKIGELTGTRFERMPAEIFINLTRAFVTIPIGSWSLLNQWATSGTGRKTDDLRTTVSSRNLTGGIRISIPEGAADSFADYLEPHKGDRNLLIRSVMEMFQFYLSLWLACYDMDAFHMSLQGICELVTSLALLYQWRHDRRSTHYVRAFVSFLMVPSFAHLAMCGHVWPWEECRQDAWNSEVRRPFRLMFCFAALRMLLNGISLVCQNAFPNRGVAPKYGNEQLFYRSMIRFAGIPMYCVITMQSFADFRGTPWERPALELVVQLIRAFIALPVLSLSLAHQWRFTGTDSYVAPNKAGVKEEDAKPVSSETKPEVDNGKQEEVSDDAGLRIKEEITVSADDLSSREATTNLDPGEAEKTGTFYSGETLADPRFVKSL
eukprot:TRINITY_DN93935_c0_g1_i2.p1 TRINITY_DN93935_c0_g1~~TRINITY_DN93935_c0_g1_i2.p1  ORF type:complete len:537 (+),score=35.29 TRINITY_DN93935_c0_g1_i2:59-1669(+)